MTVREVLVRGHQEASKRLDRIAAARRQATWSGGPMPQLTGLRTWTVGDREGILRRLWLRFFEGAAHADTTRLIERNSESRERIISTADAICQGSVDLLGYRGLKLGCPVNWHLDPVSGREAPLVHWSRINPLDPSVVWDSKVIWELNRHQWIVHLGQAYRFTGEERYAEDIARYLQQWIRANPSGMGINWLSSLEVALRLIAWCWTLALVTGAQALSAELFAEVYGGIEAHARHIERYLSHYYSPNTHLTGEALGLFYAGVLFPELPRARRWRDLGARILVEQCERQILADGVYFEQSTCYQRYTAEIYLHFLIIAARNAISVPEVMVQRLQRLIEFLIAVRRSDGSMPQIGDADGGWLLPLASRVPDDLRGIFAVAAALFGRADFAWAAGGLAPEVLWLLGPTGAKTFETLQPAPPQTAPSRVFPDGGYVVMRSG